MLNRNVTFSPEFEKLVYSFSSCVQISFLECGVGVESNEELVYLMAAHVMLSHKVLSKYHLPLSDLPIFVIASGKRTVIIYIVV